MPPNPTSTGRQNLWVFPEKKMKPRRKPKKLDTASKVIGLTTKDDNGLASSCSTSKCVYMTGCVAVVYDVDSGKQSNFVVSHRMPKPLSCIAVSRNRMFVAAGEVPVNLLASLFELKGHQLGVACMDSHPLVTYDSDIKRVDQKDGQQKTDGDHFEMQGDIVPNMGKNLTLSQVDVGGRMEKNGGTLKMPIQTPNTVSDTCTMVASTVQESLWNLNLLLSHCPLQHHKH